MSLWGLNREVYDGNVMLLLLRRNTRSTFAIAVNSFLFLAKVRACSHKHTIHTRTDTDKKTLDFYFIFFLLDEHLFFGGFFFFICYTTFPLKLNLLLLTKIANEMSVRV